MKQLKDIADKFGHSKPVFKADIRTDGMNMVEFSLKERYKPNRDDFADPVAKMMVNYYHESLDVHKRCFVDCSYITAAYENIVESVRKFYINNSPLKNPKQSKLYKWISRAGRYYSDDFKAEGLIALYRYIYKDSSTSNTKVANVLAILEMMKEKHERKNG